MGSENPKKENGVEEFASTISIHQKGSWETIDELEIHLIGESGNVTERD